MKFEELYEIADFEMDGIDFRMPVEGLLTADCVRAYKDGRLCTARRDVVKSYADIDDLVSAIEAFFRYPSFKSLTALPPLADLEATIAADKIKAEYDAIYDGSFDARVGHRFHGEPRKGE